MVKKSTKQSKNKQKTIKCGYSDILFLIPKIIDKPINSNSKIQNILCVVNRKGSMAMKQLIMLCTKIKNKMHVWNHIHVKTFILQELCICIFPHLGQEYWAILSMCWPYIFSVLRR